MFECISFQLYKLVDVISKCDPFQVKLISPYSFLRYCI